MEHYIKFTAIPYDEDGSFLVNKLFNRLHGVFVAEGFCLGLGFPLWSAENPGLEITVFGSKAQLETVLSNSGIADLVLKKMIQSGDIAPVPEGSQKVVFTRDRKKEPVSPSALRRKMKRLEKHHKAKGLPWSEAAFLAENPIAPNKVRKKLPFVVVERSSGNFRLYIDKAEPKSAEPNKPDGFSQYGLCGGESTLGAWVYNL